MVRSGEFVPKLRDRAADAVYGQPGPTAKPLTNLDNFSQIAGSGVCDQPRVT